MGQGPVSSLAAVLRTVNMAAAAAIPPQRLRVPLDPRRLRIMVLRLQLQDEEERHAAILARLIAERQQLAGRRARRWWVRPWIERRRLFGQYDTLFKELERESHGDYMQYIRMDPNTFGEILLRVAPRITKGPRYTMLPPLTNANYIV